MIGYTDYAGYVSPRRKGVAWEAGLINSRIKESETSITTRPMPACSVSISARACRFHRATMAAI
ncbi:MAG: hypothetical protein WDN06_07055 [Asticcacaulis sp.]